MSYQTLRAALLALLTGVFSAALTFALTGPAQAAEPPTEEMSIIESDLLDLDDHGMWVGPFGAPVFLPGPLLDPPPPPRHLPPIVGGGV
jgi:alkanesulfonate monooxygenase SsuD/methylene tetrahydromethanopterin reductase-like flavin-dependent oxidoreductase (luciferase family)